MAAPHTKTFEWTAHRQKRVQYMMAQGERMTDIARSLGCNVSTLQRYLAKEE